MISNRIGTFAVSSAIFALLCLSWAAESFSQDLSLTNREDKATLTFTPKAAGKVILSGKWEGSAKSLDAALYSPSQWIAHWRGSIVNKSFELSWDFTEKDIEESDRPWKIVLRAKGGDAKGEVDVAGDAVEVNSDKGNQPPSDKNSAGRPKEKSPDQKSSKPDDIIHVTKDDIPAIPLGDFGFRAQRIFAETPFYKPWVDKITAGKKGAKAELRPLGLTVTPGIRKIQTRYGGLSLTVRNITLTPAENVSLTESLSGSVETQIEILIRVEVPGWHLLAVQIAPFSAYPGEPPRMTAMQVETRSLTRGEVIPATSYPMSTTEPILLIPILLSQPGEYLFTGRPLAAVQSEILFTLGGIELFRLSS